MVAQMVESEPAQQTDLLAEQKLEIISQLLDYGACKAAVFDHYEARRCDGCTSIRFWWSVYCT